MNSKTPTECLGERQRRAHSKLRMGCDNCKRRRIKCLEQFPQCFECTRHKVECSYQQMPPEEKHQWWIKKNGTREVVTPPKINIEPVYEFQRYYPEPEYYYQPVPQQPCEWIDSMQKILNQVQAAQNEGHSMYLPQTQYPPIPLPVMGYSQVMVDFQPQKINMEYPHYYGEYDLS